MKAKFIFFVGIIVSLSMGTANSQIIPSITRVSLSAQDKAILDQQLNEYTPFTIEKRELIDSLYKNGTCQFQIHIDRQRSWTIDLEFNDMRAPDFKQTYITDEGEFEMEDPFVLNTFKGKTSDNQTVRFTIDEKIFFGVILDHSTFGSYIIY